MTLTVVNDWHLGAIRSGGTTPFTAFELRQQLLAEGKRLLNEIHGDLLVNGDLFDTFNIPLSDLRASIGLFSQWLFKNPNSTLYLSRGNHDAAKNSKLESSFDFFGALLKQIHEDRVVVIYDPMHLPQHDTYVIPHMPNQDLFNLALEEVPTVKFLFLHCNVDNKFAMEADHSLNISLDQARAAPVDHIIVAHEHQRSEHLKGKVQVVGNQFPSSIADCLGNKDKWYVEVGDGKLSFKQSWVAEGDFARPDWQALDDAGARFIRVEGIATAAQAADVASRISKFRSKSPALVITNAVKIEGQDDAEKLELTSEEIKRFDVLGALYETLTEAEVAVVKKLLESK